MKIILSESRSTINSAANFVFFCVATGNRIIDQSNTSTERPCLMDFNSVTDSFDPPPTPHPRHIVNNYIAQWNVLCILVHRCLTTGELGF